MSASPKEREQGLHSHPWLPFNPISSLPIPLVSPGQWGEHQPRQAGLTPVPAHSREKQSFSFLALPQPSWAQLALHALSTGKTDELQSLRLPELSTGGPRVLEEFCLLSGFLCLSFLSKNISDPTASAACCTWGYNFQCLSTSACYLLR